MRANAFELSNIPAERLDEVLTDPTNVAAWAEAGEFRVRSEFSPRVRLRRIMAVYDQVLGGRAGFHAAPADQNHSRTENSGAAG